MIKQCGQFSYDTEVGTLTGPAEYMREQGDAKLEAILDGRDSVFNLTASQSPDIPTAILVALQTDFAGWLGMKQTEAWLRAGK